MKTLVKIVAMKLAIVGLTIAACNGLRSLGGSSQVNGPSQIDGLATVNGLQSIYGLCPSIVPCSSSRVTAFIAV